jgi:hypothetical protein
MGAFDVLFPGRYVWQVSSQVDGCYHRGSDLDKNL